MERYETAKKVGIIGIIGNTFLFLCKIIVGIFSMSMSMLADALNSFSDIFSSLMTWIGNRISSVANDYDHNFGHGKAEYIFSLLISISMILISIKLLFYFIDGIVSEKRMVFSWNLVFVCLITIIVKICLYFYTKASYLKNNNLLVKASMIDHGNDCFITSLTLIAIILSKYHFYYFDGAVGIIISIWIFISGLKIFKESYNVLMDSSIDEYSRNTILGIIKKRKSIKRIGTLYSIPIGYKYVIVLTIYVKGKMNTACSHKITDELEKEILGNLDIIDRVIIHVEPYEKNG